MNYTHLNISKIHNFKILFNLTLFLYYQIEFYQIGPMVKGRLLYVTSFLVLLEAFSVSLQFGSSRSSPCGFQERAEFIRLFTSCYQLILQINTVGAIEHARTWPSVSGERDCRGATTSVEGFKDSVPKSLVNFNIEVGLIPTIRLLINTLFRRFPRNMTSFTRCLLDYKFM